MAAVARQPLLGFNRPFIASRRQSLRSLAITAAMGTILLAWPAQAQRSTTLQARTTGELADLCAASPRDPLGDAKINFCHGYAQGVIQDEIRRAEGKKAFCFPTPPPTRTATMNEFVAWVRALPEHRTPPVVEGLIQFLGERYPCK
jgi:Rap1a immunity proteins